MYSSAATVSVAVTGVPHIKPGSGGPGAPNMSRGIGHVHAQTRCALAACDSGPLSRSVTGARVRLEMEKSSSTLMVGLLSSATDGRCQPEALLSLPPDFFESSSYPAGTAKI